MANERRGVGMFFPAIDSDTVQASGDVLSAISKARKQRSKLQRVKDKGGQLEVKMVYGRVVTMKSPRPLRPRSFSKRQATPRQKRMKRSIFATMLDPNYAIRDRDQEATQRHRATECIIWEDLKTLRLLGEFKVSQPFVQVVE